MSGAVEGISQSQLLPSLDCQWKQGGSWQAGWPRAAVFHPPVKDFSVIKASEEMEGMNLCVKPTSVACQVLQHIQVPGRCEGSVCLPPGRPPQMKGIPCLGRKGRAGLGLVWLLGYCPARLLLH